MKLMGCCTNETRIEPWSENVVCVIYISVIFDIDTCDLLKTYFKEESDKHKSKLILQISYKYVQIKRSKSEIL